jgi:hypothetical protein
MNHLEIYIERHNLDPVKTMQFLQGIKGVISDNAINPFDVSKTDAVRAFAALEWKELINENKDLKNK